MQDHYTPLCEALAQLRETIPPVFAGTRLDTFTGYGYRWRTLQNEKSRGEVPPDVFVESNQKKRLLHRDNFLSFWQRKLNGA